MIFDSKNGCLYDDEGVFLKKISCPFGLHPDQLHAIGHHERRCNVCEMVVYGVDDVSDDLLREMIERDEKVCIFSTSNARNIKILGRSGEVGVNSEGYVVVQTLRSLESMAAAQAKGYRLLFRDVGAAHSFGESKVLVLQQNDTGELWWANDFRDSLFDKALADGAESFDDYRDEKWTVIKPWSYVRRDQPFPLAAYAVPKTLQPGVRVFVPDVIEDIGYVFWNQGDAQRVLSSAGTWTGEDLIIDVPPPPEIVG
jgi:hypothetical protein